MANLGSNHEEVMMVQAERYDILVLSSGEGGKFLAWHMAKSGRRCAVVERKLKPPDPLEG
jgi:choline dehydrogenase-like flavoprotein